MNIDATLPNYSHHLGDRPTLVFLHFWGGTSRTWDAVVGELEGHDIITIDARGWGASRDLAGPYDLEQLARDTLAVVSDAGVNDFVLVGHSSGGKVAQLAAAAHPSGLRGVVLVGSAPPRPLPSVTPEFQDQLVHAYDSEDSAAGVISTVLTTVELSPATLATAVSDARASDEAARVEWPLRGITQDITGQAKRVEVPVLVVVGADDQVESPADTKEFLLPYLATSRLMVLPAVGHLVPLEAPGALAREIDAFVASLA